MKNRGYELLRKCQFPLLLATGVAPWLFYTNADRGLAVVAWIPWVYLLGACLAMALPKKLRWFWGAAAALLLLGLGYRGDQMSFLWSAGFALMLLLGIPTAAWSWEEELPKGFYWVGLASHAICYFMLFKRDYEGDPLPGIAVWGIGICFLCFVLLTILGLNRSALVHAALGRHRAAVSVRRRNLLTILGFFLATCLISFTPVLPGLLYRGFRWLLLLLTRWAEKPQDPYYEPVDEITFPPDSIRDTVALPDRVTVDRLDPGGTPWATKGGMTPLVWIFCILAAILVAMGLWVVLRLALRLLRGLSHPAEEGYVDEITSLRPARTKKKNSLRSETGTENWGRLSPVWKIRRRYAKLIKKHRWGASRTARENLPGTTASLYEQARYSGMEVTAKQAEQFLKETK